MRLTAFLLTLTALQLNAREVASQHHAAVKVTYEARNEPLEKVFAAVRKQTGYFFFYQPKWLRKSGPVTISARDMPLESFLDRILQGQPLSYAIEKTTVVIRRKYAGPEPAGMEPEEEDELYAPIRGKVVDELTEEPMSGVSVVIRGTSTGTVTDAQGAFTMNVERDAVLVFSFVGYETLELPVGGQSEISVRLRVQNSKLDQIVVTGYGTSKRKDLTGAIASVQAEQFETQSVNYLTEMLRGTVPGLNTTIGPSAKGSADFEIRGTSSISANNTPLIVIDGIIYIGSLADINPNDVEKIDVLKDASAAAVFGSRAAAGVVMITTKKGSSRRPTVTYNGKMNFAKVGPSLRPRGPQAYLQQREDIMIRDNPARPEGFYNHPSRLPAGVSLDDWRNMGNQAGTDEEIWLNRIGLADNEIQNYFQNKTTDWFNQVYRVGLRHDQNISVSGRGESVNYYVSLGYLDNEGIIVGDQFKNLRGRINIDANITSFLKIGINSQFSARDESALPASVTEMKDASPYGDKYDENGRLKWYPNEDIVGINPFLYTEQGGSKYHYNADNLTANLYAELTLPFNFKYRVNWINSLAYSQQYSFTPSTVPDGQPAGVGSRRDAKYRYWMVDNILSWQKQIGEHSLDLTLLYNSEKQLNWASSMSNANFFPNEALGFSGLHIGTNPSLGVMDTKSTGDAIMGRLNYGLMDKYLFTVSMRRDGYSAFGKANPYAYFPAAAFAWRISNEKFFQSNKIDNLKLRLSYGENGNRDIGIYSALSEMAAVYYLYGTTPATGLQTVTMANSDLRWERTSAYNLGVDISMLSSRITASLDAYYMSTKDLLLERSLPDIIGFKTVMANLGEITNRGLELSVSSLNIRRPNFTWRSNFVFSMNRNRIEHLYGDMVDVLDANGNVIGQREDDDVQNGWYIGQALDRIFDYRVLGVWQVKDAAEAAIYGNEPGDFRLEDVNGDGKLLPQDDRVFQGYTKPRYIMSFGNEITLYRNFGISAMFSANLDYFGDNNIHRNNSTFFARVNNWDVPYWTPQNPTNEWGRLRSTGIGTNYWVSRSFLKLQSLSLSYNFPVEKIAAWKMQKLQVYFNVQNLILGTPWDYGDPEIGRVAPIISTIGINMSL